MGAFKRTGGANPADSGTYVQAMGSAAVITTAATPVAAQKNRYSSNATGTALAPVLPALSGLTAGPTEFYVEKDVSDTSATMLTITCAGSDTFEDGVTTAKVLQGPGDWAVLVVVSIAGTKYWTVKTQGPNLGQNLKRILRPVKSASPVPYTLLTAFQSGHGWTDQGGTTGGSSNLNWTGSFEYGSQSLLVSVPASASSNRTVRGPSFTAIDLTGKTIALLCMVDVPTALGQLVLTIGNSGYTNFVQLQAAGGGAASPTLLEANTWTWVHFQYADQVNTSGSPTKTGVTDMQIRVNNQGSLAANVALGALGYFTEKTTFPHGCVSLTFDDTYASHFNFARPTLDAFGWRGDEFVIIGNVGLSGSLTQANLDDLQGMHGWSINGHSTTVAQHALGLTGMSAAQAEQELQTVKQWLVSNGYNGADLFATPQSLDSPAVDAIIGRYFSFCRSTLQRPYQPLTLDKRGLRARAFQVGGTNAATVAAVEALVDSAYTNGWWLILLFHDLIASGSDTATAFLQSDFTTLMAYINTKGIPVRTIAEVIAAS